MVRILRLAALLVGLAAVQAHASFHLWVMNEVYSNADGSVQFLELSTSSGGQEFLTGHTLTTTGSAGGSRSFTFPSDLPGNTQNKTFLVATQGFAALGIVTPDYVVPNGFFFQNGGSINFASVDVWNHGALPTDNRSLSRSGSTAVNSPRNFAGQSGTVPVSGTSSVNVQGLWYRGDVESGWGVNIAHQGNVLFVTWFTYDNDRSQMWLVGSNFNMTTPNTYTGTLFRTTGSAFNANPFVPISPSNITTVGSGTFTFNDANSGTFTYTVNGVTQSKPIVRQVFSPTTPTCTQGGPQGATINFSDLWYRGDVESGWGVNLTQQGDIIFATWFTYDGTGKGMWVVGPAITRTTGNTFTGAIYRTTGDPFSADPWHPLTAGDITQVGTATFTFSDASNGTFSYTVNGVSGSKAIVRQIFATPTTVCR